MLEIETSLMSELGEELLGRWDHGDELDGYNYPHLPLDHSATTLLYDTAPTARADGLSMRATKSHNTANKHRRLSIQHQGLHRVSFRLLLRHRSEPRQRRRPLRFPRCSRSLIISLYSGSLGGESETTWETTDHSARPVTIQLHTGQPNVPAILREVVCEAEISDSVTVGTCGPESLTRSVSDAVADEIDRRKVFAGEQRRNIVSDLCAT